MKQFNMALFFMIVLVSCAPSESVVQTTISRTQTALSTVTTKLTVTPSGTSEPSQTQTKLPTFTPTVTPTFTPIPTDSFLLQEDFEDGVANGWRSFDKNNWVIEKGADGNRYLSKFGSAAFSEIVYQSNTSHWIDYAFESRIKFVEGRNFNFIVRNSSGTIHLRIYEGQVWFAQYDASSTEFTVFDPTISKIFDPNKWYTIRVEIKGNLISAYVDNAFVLSVQLPDPLVNKRGGIGLMVFDSGKIYVDDIRVWLLK